MKTTIKPFFYILLIITFLIGYGVQVYAQKKVNITTGIGIPELLNLGVYYQLDQVQMGLSVGSIPVGSDDKLLSISGDVFYHFGGSSELSNRRPWYGRLGLNYLREETEYSIIKYTHLNIRVGRDLNISTNLGIRLGAGGFFEVIRKEKRKKPKPSGGLNLNFDVPIIPSLGIGLFYKI